MADIKCIMWNCSGILSSSSSQEKIDFLLASTDFKFDILVLVETHHKLIHDIQSTFHAYSGSYHLVHTGAENDDPYAGIIVLINKNFTVSDENVLLSGRLLNFRIKSDENREYNISAIYGFTGKNASQAKMQNMVDKLSTCHSPTCRNLILGDFNFVEDDLDRVNESRIGINKTDASLRVPWVRFAAEIDISDPFRVRNPKRRMFSYIHTQNKAKSRIDRVYTNEEYCQNVTLYRHIPTPFTMAHRMVTFTIKEDARRGRNTGR